MNKMKNISLASLETSLFLCDPKTDYRVYKRLMNVEGISFTRNLLLFCLLWYKEIKTKLIL